MNDNQREARGERVLWEDERVFVLVDYPKSNPRALVIPKSKAMFPTDVTSKLLDHLAMVAAATSDAFAAAVGKHYGQGFLTSITTVRLFVE
jgi:diadenosine tetraphosphate (Ap4A) HIT family hydrolase